jgi:hypothetical protein
MTISQTTLEVVMLLSTIVALVIIAAVVAGFAAYYSPRFAQLVAQTMPRRIRRAIHRFEDSHRCDLCFRLKRLHAVEDGYGTWVMSLCDACDPRSCDFCGLSLTKYYAAWHTNDDKPVRACNRVTCRLNDRPFVGACNGCGDKHLPVRQGANKKYALCAHCAPAEPLSRAIRVAAIGIIEGYRAWYAGRDSFLNRPLVEHIAYRVGSERLRLALLRFSHFHICPTCRHIRKEIYDVEDSRGNCVMRACAKCHPNRNNPCEICGDPVGPNGTYALCAFCLNLPHGELATAGAVNDYIAV